MQIVGREKEIDILKKCYDSNMSEFIAVYGRRRIGKTYLIKNYFNDFDFDFTATYHSTTKELLEQFQIKINNKTGRNKNTPNKWIIAFNNLTEYLLSLKKEKVLVFIDELPWLDTQQSNFINAFSYFINTWESNKCLLKIITCGSSTSWMINNLIGDKGGLHGRTTRQIYLSPFNLKETEEYLTKFKNVHFDKKQILDLYMIVGGIPYYLNLFDYTIPITKNIDELFFKTNSEFKQEFNFLFESLFSNSENYKKVICALSNKLYGLTRDEIIQITNLDGGYLTVILENLRKCDFIRIYTSPNKKKKGTIYQLIDLFTLFYLRFVENNDGQDQSYWSHVYNSSLVNSWKGYAFEQVCLIHANQIKEALGISGILTNIYSWSEKETIDNKGNKWSGGQIDLLIDRNDGSINACEIKYSNDTYYISKEYEEKIRKRTSSFIHSIKTRKNIINTFITTYGVSSNSIVDVEIKFESLFK